MIENKTKKEGGDGGRGEGEYFFFRYLKLSQQEKGWNSVVPLDNNRVSVGQYLVEAKYTECWIGSYTTVLLNLGLSVSYVAPIMCTGFG